MRFSNKQSFLMVGLLVGLVGCNGAVSTMESPGGAAIAREIPIEVVKELVVEAESSFVQDLEVSSEASDVAASDSGTLVASDPEYAVYSQERFDYLLGKKGFVVSFHADWCHVCQGLDEKISSTLSTFPEGSTILKANFDREVALRQKYGIPMQSTFLVFDKMGKAIDLLVVPSMRELKMALEKVV